MFTADQAEVYQATTTNQMTFTKAEKAKINHKIASEVEDALP